MGFEELLREAETIRDRESLVRSPGEWRALPGRAGATRQIEPLLAWARARGASWDGIEFRVDGDVSVVATRAIAIGERILTLPRNLMIFDDATGDPRDVLASWLAQDDPDSRWRPYFDALPATLPELPMFRDDLSALAGTAAYAIAVEDNRDVREAYERLSPGVSLADFAWGCAIVKSRGYHAPGTLEHRIALLPLVDLFNHGLGSTTWTYHPHEGLVITAERAFAIGDEVHFTYGERSNTWLFVHHGFALPDNPYDEAGLLFDRAADPVNDVAARLLWNVELPARLSVACTVDDRFARALSLARLQACGPLERARAIAVGFSPFGDLPWLGHAHEVAAFAIMAAAAHRALAAIETRPCDPICVLVRESERATLERFVELCHIAIEYLGSRDPTRMREIPALRQYLNALSDELTRTP